MKDSVEEQLWCPEKECLLYDYESRSHQGSTHKLRRVIKCPNCFLRIFEPAETPPPGKDYRQWTLQKFMDHSCPGQADELVWKWTPTMNAATSARSIKKEVAQARRAKFAEMQKQRKKQATEANKQAAQASVQKRKYHSHQDVVRMNQEASSLSNTVESHSAAPQKATTAPVRTIQTMHNPMFASPPNESTKRTLDDCPDLTIPGSEEKARRELVKSSGISDDLAATSIQPQPPAHPK